MLPGLFFLHHEDFRSACSLALGRIVKKGERIRFDCFVGLLGKGLERLRFLC